MGIFCLFWIPLCFLLWRVLPAENRSGGGRAGIWAPALGCLAVVAQAFLGPLVPPGGFGVMRWIGGFIDVVSAPVLVPLLVYLLLVEMTVVPEESDHASFALMWLVPVAAFNAFRWSSPGSPVMLLAVPVLWSSLAIGMPALLARARSRGEIKEAVPEILCLAALPFAAASSWWALFSHRTVLGLALLAATAVPAGIAVCRPLVATVAAIIDGLKGAPGKGEA